MKPVLILAAGALVLFLAFQALFGSSTVGWHQWQTLVIETPQGEVRGSAVTRVDPDDLAAVFGEGVQLKAVMLEITEAAGAGAG